MFTQEEIKYIEKNSSFIVNQWIDHLIGKIIDLAKKKGISDLYWNSSETVNSGNTHKNTLNFFYESVPSRLGFTSVAANLRNKGYERLWHKSLNARSASSKRFASTIPLDRVPPKYQGAVIGILKHRGPYSKEELKKVFDLIASSQGKNEKGAKSFWYDPSKQWNSSQRFSHQSEMVVLQYLTKEVVDEFLNDPILKKFLLFLYSQSQHFGNSVIGFALVSPLSEKTWVINEVQTDSIRRYIKIRKDFELEESRDESVLSLEAIKDRLTASNRDMWWQKLNEKGILSKIQNDPSIIDRLPTNASLIDAGGVDAWLSNNKDTFRMLTGITASNWYLFYRESCKKA